MAKWKSSKSWMKNEKLTFGGGGVGAMILLASFVWFGFVLGNNTLQVLYVSLRLFWVLLGAWFSILDISEMPSSLSSSSRLSMFGLKDFFKTFSARGETGYLFLDVLGPFVGVKDTEKDICFVCSIVTSLLCWLWNPLFGSNLPSSVTFDFWSSASAHICFLSTAIDRWPLASCCDDWGLRLDKYFDFVVHVWILALSFGNGSSGLLRTFIVEFSSCVLGVSGKLLPCVASFSACFDDWASLVIWWSTSAMKEMRLRNKTTKVFGYEINYNFPPKAFHLYIEVLLPGTSQYPFQENHKAY